MFCQLQLLQALPPPNKCLQRRPDWLALARKTDCGAQLGTATGPARTPRQTGSTKMRRAPAVKHAFPDQGNPDRPMHSNNSLGWLRFPQCLQQCEHTWFQGVEAPSTRRDLHTGPSSVPHRDPPGPRQTCTCGHASKGCQAWGLSQAKWRLPFGLVVRISLSKQTHHVSRHRRVGTLLEFERGTRMHACLSVFLASAYHFILSS